MNYVGLYALLFWGEDVLLSPFGLSDTGLNRGLLIANIGILGVFTGVWLAERLSGRGRLPTGSAVILTPRSPIGLRLGLLWLSTAATAGTFLWLFYPLAGSFFSHLIGGDISQIFEFRRAMSGRETYFMRYLGYNILPYLSLVFLVISWSRKRWAPVAYLLVVLSAVGLLHVFQKQPLIIYALQIALARFLFIAGQESAFSKAHARSFLSLLFRWVSVAILALCLTTILFFVARSFERSGDLRADSLSALQMAGKRLFMRTVTGYVMVGEFVPEHFPHYGMKSVYTVQTLLGEEYIPVGNIFFRWQAPHRHRGNLSLASLVNHYGQFGWVGLVILSILQGVILGAADVYFARREATVGLFVFSIFMMRFAIYLNETNIYGALLGFGGIAFVLMALILNKAPRIPKVESGIQPRPVLAVQRLSR
jgi:hypothetical protein